VVSQRQKDRKRATDWLSTSLLQHTATMSTLFGGASAAATTSNTVGDLKQDVALSDPPTDTISDLSFSPAPNGPDFLAISSWDNKVRIYEIAANGQSQGRHAYEHSQPVLNCDFSKVRRYNDRAKRNSN
jgi:WD40 repeat protein